MCRNGAWTREDTGQAGVMVEGAARPRAASRRHRLSACDVAHAASRAPRGLLLRADSRTRATWESRRPPPFFARRGTAAPACGVSARSVAMLLPSSWVRGVQRSIVTPRRFLLSSWASELDRAVVEVERLAEQRVHDVEAPRRSGGGGGGGGVPGAVVPVVVVSVEHWPRDEHVARRRVQRRGLAGRELGDLVLGARLAVRTVTCMVAYGYARRRTRAGRPGARRPPRGR